MPELEIKTIGGIKIYVNDRGRFYAEMDGKIVTRASLRAIERLIEQRLRPLRVLTAEKRWDWRVSEDSIDTATKRKLKGQKTSYDDWENKVYLYDDRAMMQLRGLLEKYKELYAQWDAVLKGLTKVTCKNFEALREEHASGVEEE